MSAKPTKDDTSSYGAGKPPNPPAKPPVRSGKAHKAAATPVSWTFDVPAVEVVQVWFVRFDIEKRYVVPGVGFSWHGDV